MSILCIGQAVYDISFTLDTPLQENQKYRIEQTTECGGGPACNAACLCALWGAETHLIAKVGMDAYGNALRRSLHAFHVGSDYLMTDADIRTPYSLIAVNAQSGSRTIFNLPGKPLHCTSRLPAGRVDVILSDGHEPDITLQALRAYPDACSVVDAGTLRKSTFTVCQKVDYLVCSEAFACQYTRKNITLHNQEEDESIFRQIESINHKHAVITLGERGLLYRDADGKLRHLPAYPVRAIDTSGAGDVFHGAFAYGLYRHMPLEANLRQSAMAAALSVQREGSQTAIPCFEEVRQHLYHSYYNEGEIKW